MVRFVRKLSIILALSLALLTPSLAQIDDPEATAYADMLANAYQTGNESMFLGLLQNNPLMAKKAFLASLFFIAQNANDPNSKMIGIQYLEGFAQSIQQILGDPGPTQIMWALKSGNGQQLEQATLAYQSQLYAQQRPAVSNSGQTEPPKTTTYYGEERQGMSMVPAPLRETFKAYLTKEVRLTLAMAYSDPNLVLQEVDTFDAVLDNFINNAIAIGGRDSPEVRKMVEEQKRRVYLAKVNTMAEFGLLQEFSYRTERELQKETLNSNKLAIFFTGFRVANRQHQDQKAREYLNKAKNVLSLGDEEVSPVFGFVYKTALVEQEIAEGREFSDQELLSRFYDAWSELDSYKPAYCVNHDTIWYYGRACTKFWAEQFGAMGSTGISALSDILGRCHQYFTEATSTDKFASISGTDMLFRSDEVQGMATLVLSMLDIAMQIVEANPQLVAKIGMTPSQFADSMEQSVSYYGQWPAQKRIPLQRSERGFPNYDLSQSSYIQELVTRARYLKTLDTNLSPTQMGGILKSLQPRVQQLVRPDAYLEYELKLGKRFRDIGDNNSAITAFKSALTRADELGFERNSIEASALLSEEYGKNNDWANASKYADSANQSFQSNLSSLNNLADKDLARKTDQVATVSVKAAVKSNNPEKALEVLNHSQQANTASVQLASNKQAAKASKDLNKKKRRINFLSRKVKRLKAMPESSTRNELLKKAEKVLADGKAAFLTESRRLREKFSSLYVSTLKFDPLNLPEVQKSLPADVAVIQYFATSDELYIFVVTKNNLKLRQVQIKKSELDEKVLGYVKRVKRLDRKWLDPSKELYNVLLQPVEQDFASVNTLILIPSGRLNMLPFSSLSDSTGTPIVEKKTLLSIAKTNDFFKIANTEPMKVSKVVAFANATSNLPAAEKEGEDVVALFPGSKLYARNEASAENIKMFGGKFDALHLATHGVQDPETPRNNYLSLSNGKLKQGEIFDLPLANTSVVTLSACNTATDQLHIDKNVNFTSSLAEAFWLAGSRSVMASLWKVEDKSTGLLMTNFYGKLKSGKGKANALQLAQQELRKDPNYAHPYYWSGFRFFGDYR